MENPIVANKCFRSDTELGSDLDHFLLRYDNILELPLHYPESDAIVLLFQNSRQCFKDSVLSHAWNISSFFQIPQL